MSNDVLITFMFGIMTPIINLKSVASFQIPNFNFLINYDCKKQSYFLTQKACVCVCVCVFWRLHKQGYSNALVWHHNFHGHPETGGQVRRLKGATGLIFFLLLQTNMAAHLNLLETLLSFSD